MSCLLPETWKYLILARIRHKAKVWKIDEDAAFKTIVSYIENPEKTAEEVTERREDLTDCRAFLLCDFKNEVEFWNSVGVSSEQVYEAVKSFRD